MSTSTHTVAILEVDPLTYFDIRERLKRAERLAEYLGEDNRRGQGAERINMHGLAIVVEETAPRRLHQSVEGILQFFKFDHLPEHLKEVSRPFCLLASKMAFSLPQNPELSVALRQLPEAKDAAVRAALFASVPQTAGSS